MKIVLSTILFLVIILYFISLWQGLNGLVSVALPATMNVIALISYFLLYSIAGDCWDLAKKFSVFYFYLVAVITICTFVAYVWFRLTGVIISPDREWAIFLGFWLLIQAWISGLASYIISEERS
ncbi:hypothetical protein IID20_01995 [Patescibacteria group bacterium]|nr:hypothetical protein [Patescibacteria group bacterium]